MIKNQTITVTAVFIALISWLGFSSEVQAQDIYKFFSQKGDRWEFRVTSDSKDAGTLLVTNEGSKGRGKISTVFSWIFKNSAGAITTKMELYYDRSPDGMLLSGITTYSGSRSVSTRYEPPLLVLKSPLKEEQWQYSGFKVSDKGKERYAVINTVKKVRVDVPAGTFDAFEIRGQELAGAVSVEYWSKDMGLLGMVQVQSSGNVMATKLIRYLPSPEKAADEFLRIGDRVFSRQSWGCTAPELLSDVYEASDKRERIVQQGQCIRIAEMKGYVVARRDGAVDINDGDLVLWVPIESVAVCWNTICR